MNRLTKYCLAFVVLAAALTACRRDKRIPDDVFQKIITESLITDATIREIASKSTRGQNVFSDTIDYYKPIAEKYGYTMQDVRNTIEYMATRKSNPMSNILDNVVRDIEILNKRANYLYNGALKFDTLALRHYTDTVYVKDTTIKGSLKNYSIFIPAPPKGEYTLKFDYRTVEDTRSPLKSVKYRLSALSDNSIKTLNGPTQTLSRTRQNKDVELNCKIHVPKTVYDSLYIDFNDGKIIGNYKGADTSYISNIRLIYTPTLEDARAEYLYELIGIGKPLEEIDYGTENPQDSLALPAVGKR